MPAAIFRFRSISFFRKGYWYLMLFLCCGATGCVENKDKIIADKVQERLSEYRKKRTDDCRSGILSKAEKKVDSLLLAEAQQALQDSLGRQRPFRPVQPPPVLPIDTLTVKPLFRQ